MKIRIIICLVIAAMLAGCKPDASNPVMEPSNGIRPYMREYSNREGDRYWYVVDENTGVVYIRFSAQYEGGITPALNADGTPITRDQLGLGSDSRQ